MQGNHNPADWGREGRLCATLSKKYGAEFMLWVSPPEGYQVNSLTFYYSVLGRNHLSDQLVEYEKHKGVSIPQVVTQPIATEKLDEDIVTTFKPRTLKEFLNYGKDIARQREAGQATEKSATDSNGADGQLSGRE